MVHDLHWLLKVGSPGALVMPFAAPALLFHDHSLLHMAQDLAMSAVLQCITRTLSAMTMTRQPLPQHTLRWWQP